MTPRSAAALVIALSLGLYIHTMYPAYPPDDSPETAAAAVGLGIQHPPGYPLMTIAGKLATLAPVGGPYLRMNLLSAALAASSAGAATLLVARLFPAPAGALAGAFAGLALAVSGIHWECALSAKGGIYQLNLLFTLLALLALARRAVPLSAFFVGLALANHWMSVVPWLPVFAFAGRPWSARRAAAAAFTAALGLSLYLQLPLCARREPSWGDPASLSNFLDHIRRKSFAQHATIGKSGTTLIQACYGVLTPLREGGLPFLLLAAGGFAALWRAARGPAAWLGMGAALSVAAITVAANPVHLVTGELFLWMTDRFFLPVLGATAVTAGAGLLLLRSALPKGWKAAAWAAGLLLVLAAGLPRMRMMDHARDYLGSDYAANLLVDVPDNAVILGEADYQTFPLLTVKNVEQRMPRADFLFTNPFMNRRWGWAALARRFPEARDLAGSRLPWEARVVQFAERLRADRRVFHLTMCGYDSLRPLLGFHGILLEMDGNPDRNHSVADADRFFRRFRLRGMYSEYPWKDRATMSVLDVYTLARATGAGELVKRGDMAGAAEAYRRALMLESRMSRVLLQLSYGRMLAERRDYAGAEKAFRDAVRWRPRDLDLVANLATAYAAQGKYDEAMRCFRYVLRRNPRHAAAIANMRMLERNRRM